VKHPNLPVALLLAALTALILGFIARARRQSLYIRRIPGLSAVEEAVGRAVEMGRPITFSLGLGQWGSADGIITLQALAIAVYVARLAIRYGSRVIVTTRDAIVYAVADEAMREAYAAEGRPEAYNLDDVRFLSDRQFAYASAMAGIILREKAGSNFMFGRFFAESLILAEAGQSVGAIQVAGTPSTTQIPFFIASCDYTIIGDEFYAGSAYLTREPVLLGSLIGQDYGKILLLAVIVLGILAVSVYPPAAAMLSEWLPG
jgi:hypothetical protein